MREEKIFESKDPLTLNVFVLVMGVSSNLFDKITSFAVDILNQGGLKNALAQIKQRECVCAFRCITKIILEYGRGCLSLLGNVCVRE